MTSDSFINDIDWIRISESLAGRDSPTERAEFERWTAGTPERQRLVESLARVWERAAEIQDPIDVDTPAAWRALRARLALSGATEPRIEPRGVMELPAARVGRWVGIAAAAAIVVLGVGGVLILRRASTQGVSRGQEPAVREVITAQGQRADLRLADGSRVVLGVDSKLRWPISFGAGAREVSLEGEALFVIAHDPAKPFVVHSRNAVIDDLGTEFGVRAYPEDRNVRVVVRSGTVALAVAPDPRVHRAVLQAGDGGSLAADGAMRVEHGVDVDRELAFAEGRLELTDAPMSDVARALERWYGVQLVVDDTSLAHATVNASFAAHEEFSAVLRTLGRALGARVEQRGRIVRLVTLP
jgi:transmembrane sensor